MLFRSVTLVASRKANGESQGGLVRLSDAAAGAAYLAGVELETSMTGPFSKPTTRFVVPASESTAEKTERLLTPQNGGRGRKGGSRMKQSQLPLDLHTRGRFEKSEPTIYDGQDLDLPTYIRRGIPLN